VPSGVPAMPHQSIPSYPRVESRTVLCRGRRFAFSSILLVDEKGERTVKDLLEHPGAVVVLPLLNSNKIILLYQYRPGPNKWIYELPAGTIEPGEDPSKTAMRELREETGYTAGSLKYLFSMYSSPGVSTEVMHMFLAKDLKREGKPTPEKGEFIKVVVIDYREAIGMVERGEIVDGKTIALLLYYDRFYRTRDGV